MGASFDARLRELGHPMTTLPGQWTDEPTSEGLELAGTNVLLQVGLKNCVQPYLTPRRKGQYKEYV